MSEESWKRGRMIKKLAELERSERTRKQIKKFKRIIKKQGWKKRLRDKSTDKKLGVLYLLFVREQNRLFRVRLGIKQLKEWLDIGSSSTLYKLLNSLNEEGCLEFRMVSTGRLRNIPRLRLYGRRLTDYAVRIAGATGKLPKFSEIVSSSKIPKPPDFYERLLKWDEARRNLLASGATGQEIKRIVPPFFITPSQAIAWQNLGTSFKLDGRIKEELWYWECWKEELNRLFPEKSIETEEDVYELIGKYEDVSMFIEECKRREEKAYLRHLKIR